MQLAIDIGNSFTKAALFNKNELLFHGVFVNIQEVLSSRLIQSKFKTGIICDVAKKPWNILIPPELIYLDDTFNFPFSIKYNSSKPGMDRLCAVAGAIALSGNESCFIIDAGTCITTEWYDTNLGYLGGSISPGISMRLKAMNKNTGNLPLVSISNEFLFCGNDTVSCMRSGAIMGAILEIEGRITEYIKKYPEAKIYITGGDGEMLSSWLKKSIFASRIGFDPILVLRGLNYLLQTKTEIE